MHTGWQRPLVSAVQDAQVEKVKREVTQAAFWSNFTAGMKLADYLKTAQGQPYESQWSAVEIQNADRFVVSNH